MWEKGTDEQTDEFKIALSAVNTDEEYLEQLAIWRHTRRHTIGGNSAWDSEDKVESN